MPDGSTSNYFRTRAARLSGVANAIVDRDMAGVADALHPPASAAEFVDALGAGIEYMTGPGRMVTAARLVLFFEASHDDNLRQILTRGRVAQQSTVLLALARLALARLALARLGVPDPQAAATAIMACAEDIILHRIARHDDTDPRPTLALVMNAALG